MIEVFENPDSLAQCATAADSLLGLQSRCVEVTAAVSPLSQAVQSGWFQALALVAAVAYVMLVGGYWGSLCALLQDALQWRAVRAMNVERGQSVIYNGLFKWSFLLGVAVASLAGARWVSDAVRDGAAWRYEQGGWFLAAGLFMAFIAAGYLYKYILIRAIGIVAQERELMDAMLFCTNKYVCLGAMCVVPILILSLLATPSVTRILLVVVVAECVVAILLFLKDIIMLFLTQKVSILHSFLYLCTVEVLPLSLLIAYAVGR